MLKCSTDPETCKANITIHFLIHIESDIDIYKHILAFWLLNPSLKKEKINTARSSSALGWTMWIPPPHYIPQPDLGLLHWLRSCYLNIIIIKRKNKTKMLCIHYQWSTQMQRWKHNKHRRWNAQKWTLALQAISMGIVSVAYWDSHTFLIHSSQIQSPLLPFAFSPALIYTFASELLLHAAKLMFYVYF